ncbi:LCP family protein [Micromonospora sp. NPDC047074]|uniref:LCP family protein n=1 Tax=Micromonospora sp. NPDC047074 TaxID=3154339 RepID=UPI0033CAA2CC
MPNHHQYAEPETQTPGSQPEPGDKRHRRRPRWKRVVLITFLVLALLGGGGMIAGGLYLRSVESGIERVDAFEGVPEESRPQVVTQDALNILILGSDSRDPEGTTGSRTDTIILAHLPKDRSSAQLISIPRDTWVPVPRSKDGSQGGRDAKINAAYAWGGVPLMVQAVEKFTSVRIDHVMIVDFAGFKEIIDALDGIEVDVEKNFTSIHPPFRTFNQGKQRMDGEAALDYSRQRKQFADGDFARIRHQQQVIRAIMDRAVTGGIVTNPARLNSFVKASSNAVSVDEKMSLLDMATDLRNLRSGNLTFLTSPTKGTGRVGSESVVFANPEKTEPFYDAVRRDKVADILSLGK